MSATDTPIPAPSRRARGGLRRIVTAVGVDNLSLIGALVILMILISVIAPLIGVQGGNFFWSWQNLVNSLAQSIVIVGLLAIGETVVIVGGAHNCPSAAIAASACSAVIVR